MANAFLGNLTGTTGNAISSTVTGGNTEPAAAAISSAIGAATDAHGQSLDITVNGVTTTVAIQGASTTAALAAADIDAAGTALGFTASYASGVLTISATGTGAQTISVSDTPGSAAAATLGVDNATASNAFNPANVTLQITGAGLTAPKDITFAPASTTAAAAIAELQTQVDSDANLQAAGITVTGSAGGPLVFTSYTGEKFSVQVTGDTQNALGLGAFTTNTSTTDAPDYASISGGAAYAPAASYGTANLEFSINGASTASNRVAVNLSAGDATASTVTATTAADVEGKAMTIGVAGGSLNSGPVTVAFAADTAATLTGNTATTAAGKSLTITIDGVTKTVTFAAATGAAGTATAGFGSITNGEVLNYNTGSTGALAHTGVVTFNVAAATGASSGALTYGAVTTDALTINNGDGTGVHTVTFSTPADMYAAAGQIETQAGLYVNASSRSPESW